MKLPTHINSVLRNKTYKIKISKQPYIYFLYFTSFITFTHSFLQENFKYWVIPPLNPAITILLTSGQMIISTDNYFYVSDYWQAPSDPINEIINR